MNFLSTFIPLCFSIVFFSSNASAKTPQIKTPINNEPIIDTPYNKSIYFKGCTFYFENEHLHIKTVKKVNFSTSVLSLELTDKGLTNFNVPKSHITPIWNEIASNKKECSRRLRHRMKD